MQGQPRRDCLNLDMDFGDKVAGAELPEQNPALLDSIQLSTPQSRLIGLTMRVHPGRELFVFSMSFLSPEAADHISGLFIL